MKVLVLSSVYPRFESDTEVPWLRKSLECLRGNGVEVEVLSPSFCGLRDHSIDGVRINRFRYAPKKLECLTHDEGAPSKMASRPWMQLLAVPYILSGFFRCLLISHRFCPDVIHVHWPFPHGLIALGACKVGRIPMVLNFHGAELLLIRKHPWVKHILKFLIACGDVIFANSHFTAEKIRKIRPCSVEISPYGTTLNPLSSSKVYNSDEPFRVLFVGRHIERKGLTYLIEAAAMLSPQEFQVRIVGQGDLTDALKALAFSIAPEQVFFTGKLSQEELEKEYASADVFVLPAIVDSKGDTEGLGVVLIEAADYGLPLLATNVGGIPDVVLNDVSGILVPAKDSSALAEALRRLRSNPVLCQKLVAGAQERIRDYFSWEGIISRQIEIYERSIQKKQRCGVKT